MISSTMNIICSRNRKKKKKYGAWTQEQLKLHMLCSLLCCEAIQAVMHGSHFLV